MGVLIADNDFNNDRVSVNMIKDDTDRKVNIPAGFMLAKDRYIGEDIISYICTIEPKPS